MAELEQAIQLARAGQKASARQLLIQMVKDDLNNEMAWGWLAHCAASKAERRYCLRRVVEINPANDKARAALERMVDAEKPTVEVVRLTCRKCRVGLDVAPETDHLVCGNCGSQYAVKRSGGTVSLKPASGKLVFVVGGPLLGFVFAVVGGAIGVLFDPPPWEPKRVFVFPVPPAAFLYSLYGSLIAGPLGFGCFFPLADRLNLTKPRTEAGCVSVAILWIIAAPVVSILAWLLWWFIFLPLFV